MKNDILTAFHSLLFQINHFFEDVFPFIHLFLDIIDIK